MDFVQAAERDDVQHVIELLDEAHDPNADDRGSHVRPSYIASARGHLEGVECLLDASADKEKADDQGTMRQLRSAC